MSCHMPKFTTLTSIKMTTCVTFKSFTWHDLDNGKSDQKKQVSKYSVNQTHEFGVLLNNKHPVISVGPLNEWAP